MTHPVLPVSKLSLNCIRVHPTSSHFAPRQNVDSSYPRVTSHGNHFHLGNLSIFHRKVHTLGIQNDLSIVGRQGCYRRKGLEVNSRKGAGKRGIVGQNHAGLGLLNICRKLGIGETEPDRHDDLGKDLCRCGGNVFVENGRFRRGKHFNYLFCRASLVTDEGIQILNHLFREILFGGLGFHRAGNLVGRAAGALDGTARAPYGAFRGATALGSAFGLTELGLVFLLLVVGKSLEEAHGESFLSRMNLELCQGGVEAKALSAEFKT
mmetsp:Transcript_7168/g.18227  ORF Transcript_7168/g.18227 Transcript_7168/m.18227 type:complete len:265 (+) Transcript_7168:98-892(+)